ncbi:AAA family ATPase [Micromonospora parva]|uniref:AAA family ATPase n=1 Tax=Micromonospora parva TaxID=1464048 RepID=A0ABW6VQU7_9ACTN|nr:AAA family ATPase [Micromonospora parva]
MHFVVVPAGHAFPEDVAGAEDDAGPEAFLVHDNWDDWFRFETMYLLLVRDEAGELTRIGEVKIGQFGMGSDQRSPALPDSFDRLDENFFSVGQDGTYYEQLNRLGEHVRAEVLTALHDIAADEDLYPRALTQEVTTVSLLRALTHTSVLGQFRRQALGGLHLTRFRFTYRTPPSADLPDLGATLEFDVVPESEPPTNIHVLIGSNGVGKTHLLHHLSHVVAGELAPVADGQSGTFTFDADDDRADNFTNAISVSFSAFDRFEPIGGSNSRYAYIGLKRVRRNKTNEKPLPPKDHRTLAGEFGRSVQACRQPARRGRWQRALQLLAGDPIFADAGVIELADLATSDDVGDTARDLFRDLSSGHKIVLLTMTRLVETVEERSLVLLDEPEAHLHPPLLAAFVRALSDLLINRNGVAIIATHSPVVLQEVPRVCAWKLRRAGDVLVAERPEIETFGENVGVLTREVFGLEVTRSGFHKVLRDAVAQGQSYPEIVERFDGRLGGEARALVRGLIAVREAGGAL